MRWLVVFVAACKFTAHQQVDGAVGSDGTHDATDGSNFVPPDGPKTCLDAWKDHTIVVDAPTRIAELDTNVDERDPFVTADEKTIYFSQDHGTIGVDMDIMVATRATPGGTFGSADFIGLVDDGDDQSKASVSADGLSAVIAVDSVLSGQGGVDLWMTTRATTADKFDTETQTIFLNIDDNKDQSDPWLSADGSRLYYANVGSNHQVIAMATRDGSGNYGNVQTLIDSGSGDADPTLSADELVIVFSSNRSGAGDLYYATRTSTEANFGTAIAIDALNTADQDGDPHLSADGCHVYFASNTNSGSTPDYNLFVANAHP